MRMDKIVHSFAYYSREDRNKIIERWREIYREDFERFKLIIAPKTIADNHQNETSEIVGHSEPFVRPPAVYDNITNYNY